MGFFKGKDHELPAEPKVSTLFEAIKDGTFRNPYLMPDKYEPEHAKPRGKHKRDKD